MGVTAGCSCFSSGDGVPALKIVTSAFSSTVDEVSLEGYFGGYLSDYLGDYMGDYIGDCLGDYLGYCLGYCLGDYIGDSLGDYLGNCLGDYFGDYLGAYIGDSLGDYFGCLDAYLVDYLRDYSDIFGDYFGDYLGCQVFGFVSFVGRLNVFPFSASISLLFDFSGLTNYVSTISSLLSSTFSKAITSRTSIVSFLVLFGVALTGSSFGLVSFFQAIGCSGNGYVDAILIYVMFYSAYLIYLASSVVFFYYSLGATVVCEDIFVRFSYAFVEFDCTIGKVQATVIFVSLVYFDYKVVQLMLTSWFCLAVLLQVLLSSRMNSYQSIIVYFSFKVSLRIGYGFETVCFEVSIIVSINVKLDSLCVVSTETFDIYYVYLLLAMVLVEMFVNDNIASVLFVYSIVNSNLIDSSTSSTSSTCCYS